MGLLEGKNAVITGARRGIGRATVAAFASEGANVWACARSHDPEHEEFCSELSEGSAGFVKPVYFDLEDRAQVKAAVKAIRSEKIDVTSLVNCAGIVVDSAPFSMTKAETVAHVYDINVIRQMELTQYMLRLMANGASIVNLSSIAAEGGMPGQYAYACSKAAVEAWTKTLAIELAPRDIRVNAVAPGFVDTDMGNRAAGDLLDRILESTILKRMARPSEVADAIAYLASDKSSYVTGQVVSLSGGCFAEWIVSSCQITRD